MMNNQDKSRHSLLCLAIAGMLLAGIPRRAPAESLLDFKTLYYIEDGDRIRVIAPTVAYQTELDQRLTIRVEGIFNSISGATPTGAPAAPRMTVMPPVTKSVRVPKPIKSPIVIPPDDDDDDNAEEEEDGAEAGFAVPAMKFRAKSGARSGLSSQTASSAFNSLSGATPPPTPKPTPPPKTGKNTTPAPTPRPGPTGTNGQAPSANFDDERTAFNIDLSYRAGRHTPGLQLSYSSESDYLSRGVAVKDTIDFNQKCTTLLLGAGVTFDTLNPANATPKDDKITLDIMAGVTQLIDPRTQVTLNATLGRSTGFLSDPYKVVELNGILAPEKRPDRKDKQILYAALTRFFEAANGSLETGYRFYNDSFGIQAHTVTLAWYQKLGEHWVVRPLVRYYTQSEAAFYGVRFSGAPSAYSSDYRVSEMSAVGGGLKVIWMPTSRLSFDVSYERYEQSGKDDVTPGDIYPSANAFMVGARLWF